MKTKTESIKIRITKKDKDRLMKKAKSSNESLSGYMLRKSLCGDSDLSSVIPQEIDIWNFFNEIYHEIDKKGSEQLKADIQSIYQKYITDRREED